MYTRLGEKEIEEDIKRVRYIEINQPELAIAIREYVKADKNLNAIYKMLMDIYEKVGTERGLKAEVEKNKLQSAQLAWLKYRDLAVESELSLHVSKKEYYTSLAELTEQRIERMKSMLENMRDSFGGKGPYVYESQATQALDKFKKMEEKK